MIRQTGFTLLELAVVLFVIALMLGGLLGPLSVRLEQGDRDRAEQDLAQIKEAILGFAVASGRLPCPDCVPGVGGCNALAAALLNDGIEDLTTVAPVTCVANNAGFSVGNVPWVTLGTPTTDPWERSYAYGVNTSFADTTAGTTGCSGGPALGVSFELCSTAAGQVNDSGDAGFNIIAAGVPAIALSYGSNGGVAPVTTHEQENFDGDPTAVLKGFSRDGVDEFDDQLVWISVNVLLNRMIMAGRLP